MTLHSISIWPVVIEQRAAQNRNPVRRATCPLFGNGTLSFAIILRNDWIGHAEGVILLGVVKRILLIS